MKQLTAPQRLIIAADFKPNPTTERIGWTYHKVLELANALKKTGVTLKVNSALRACGYSLIDEIHERNLAVFADLKLFDIKETLTIDGILLNRVRPELLTVSCVSGRETMRALKHELPDTEILGVSVLTNLNDEDSQAMFTCSTKEAILRFSSFAEGAVDGLISAATEAEMLRERFGAMLTLNTPAIRPVWSIVEGDDQNKDRIMTPFKAIKAGADRIVIGRPITQAKSPYDAAMRTIEEIEKATDCAYS